MTIEAIVRNLTKDPERVLALLEYSYSNVFDYIVEGLVRSGMMRPDAQMVVLRQYLGELEAKRVM